MSFEKDLRKAVESIDIPEELLPVNIEAMLRNADRSAQKNTSADIDRSEKITAKKTNRTIIMWLLLYFTQSQGLYLPEGHSS